MLGDAFDLSEILRWAKIRFWDDMLNPDGSGAFLLWPFPQAVRLEVAEALVDLAKCFDGAEQAHRKENLLTGSKGEVKVCLCVVQNSARVNHPFVRKPPINTTRFLRLVGLS